jgi:hypothetical protein
VRKFVQNLLAATIVIASASTVFAQYGSRGSSSGSGYYTGSSSYGSSVSFGTPNELIMNLTGVSTNGSLQTGKGCKNCDNVTNISIGANYLRTINANIQAGAQAKIESISGGNSETLLTLVALGVYNFDTTFKDAFFAQGGFGIYPVPKENAPGHESKFGFMIGGGKRFPLWGNVNYIPSASLVKRGDLDIGFDIEFMNFSVMF